MGNEIKFGSLAADLQGIGTEGVQGIETGGVVNHHPQGLATHVPVMTEEQLETLRRQISVYATICRQFLNPHNAIQELQNAMHEFHLNASIGDSFPGIGDIPMPDV